MSPRKPKSPKVMKPQLSFNETKEFKALQKIWYDKLTKKGFVDIESEDYRYKRGVGINETTRVRDKMRQAGAVGVIAVQDYYSKANALLDKYKFKKPIDKRIWELHASGLTDTEIVKAINGVHKRTYVQRLVQLISNGEIYVK